MVTTSAAMRQPGGLARFGFQTWTTRDLVTIALLVAVGGVFKGYWGGVRLALESSLGPLFTGWIIGAGSTPVRRLGPPDGSLSSCLFIWLPGCPLSGHLSGDLKSAGGRAGCQGARQRQGDLRR